MELNRTRSRLQRGQYLVQVRDSKLKVLAEFPGRWPVEHMVERRVYSSVKNNRGGYNPCDVDHYKVLSPCNGTIYDQQYKVYVTFTNFPITMPIPISINPRVPWEMLLSSSKFGITQFLAELDETIMMILGRIAWKFFNVEEYTYGWAPFLADLGNMMDGFNRMSKLIDQKLMQRVGMRVELPPGETYVTASHRSKRIYGQFVQSGVINLKGMIPQVALDNFGLHLDANVLWDLIPLSFMLDYLIPIGDFLDSLRPSGWVRTVPFLGSLAVTDTVYTTQSYHYPVSTLPYEMGTVTKYYTRRHVDSVIDIDFNSKVDWELPTFRELLNMIWFGKDRVPGIGARSS